MHGTSRRAGSGLSGLISMRMALGARSLLHFAVHRSGLRRLLLFFVEELAMRQLVCKNERSRTDLHGPEDHLGNPDLRIRCTTPTQARPADSGPEYNNSLTINRTPCPFSPGIT